MLKRFADRWQEFTWDAAAALKALRTTSVTRWLVSTLPPTTAAVGEGLRMVSGGMRTVMGFKQPCKDLPFQASLYSSNRFSMIVK